MTCPSGHSRSATGVSGSAVWSARIEDCWRRDMRSNLNRLAAALLRVLASVGLLIGLAGGIGHLSFGACERIYPPSAGDPISRPYAGAETVPVACNPWNEPEWRNSVFDLDISIDWTTRTKDAALWAAGGVALFAGAMVAARKLDPPAEGWRRPDGGTGPTPPAP